MADLNDIEASLSIKIAGANPSTGVEDNYMEVDSAGRTTSKITDSAGLAINLGQTTMALSLPVTFASNQSALSVSQSGTWNINNIFGTISLPTGAATSALQTTGNSSLSSIDTKTPALGQALAAASTPVVLTAAQITTLTPLSTVAVTQSTSPWVISAASLPLPTGAATAALQTQPSVDIGDVTINNGSGEAAVNIQDGGNTITVDGTIAATQSGTWTVQPGNTQNTTAWLTQDASDGSVTAGTVATKSGLIGGQYNSTLPTLTTGQQAAIQVDSSGRLIISGTTNQVPAFGTGIAYATSSPAFATAASATDIFTIKGSASKTIYITMVSVAGTTTAGSGITVSISLIKRSSANTGGTSTTLTAVPYDSTNAAATAVAVNYTANPTSLGTSLGAVRCIRQTINTAGATGTAVVWEFGSRPAQPIILRGTSEFLCINFNATTITGPLICASIEWTEA